MDNCCMFCGTDDQLTDEHVIRAVDNNLGSTQDKDWDSREHIREYCGTEAGWQVSNMSTSMKLVLGGIVLMVIGVSAFLHSLGSGGGYGATLTFIAGAVVVMIGFVMHFLKKPDKTP